jgi:hypothetical protein
MKIEGSSEVKAPHPKTQSFADLEKIPVKSKTRLTDQ